MKRLFVLALGITLCLSLTAKVFAQTDDEDPQVKKLKQGSPEDQKWYEALSASSREPRVLKKSLLAPSEADRLQLAAFLQTPDTGLVRLLPREVYDSETYHTKKVLNVRGGGAYYSFADLTHAYGYGSDIQLDHNTLSVGFAGADYGMITNLGDQPLESLEPNDLRFKFLLDYKAPKPEADARAEFRRFQQGTLVDGAVYKSRVAVEVSATYLLRSIVYRKSDLLVAFRVVRQDTDGSVTLAWKLLKQYDNPQLARVRVKSFGVSEQISWLTR
jgi:hypothetical protein